jgi:rubrerythrin
VIYEEHLRAAESAAWSVETSIPWRAVDRDKARAEPAILASLRDAAMIEGYLPTFAPRLMLLLWDDVDATAILSLELYEGLKHYTALRRYLDIVGDEASRLSERALVTAREGTSGITYRRDEIITYLTHFMCSELFAAHFFRRLAEQTREPVLAELLGYMSRDELRHSAGAGALLKKRIAANPEVAAEILAAAENFRHYGSDVVDIPLAEENDFEAIMAMNRKIRQLCGLAPTEHLEEELTNG